MFLEFNNDQPDDVIFMNFIYLEIGNDKYLIDLDFVKSINLKQILEITTERPPAYTSNQDYEETVTSVAKPYVFIFKYKDKTEEVIDLSKTNISTESIEKIFKGLLDKIVGKNNIKTY